MGWAPTSTTSGATSRFHISRHLRRTGTVAPIRQALNTRPVTPRLEMAAGSRQVPLGGAPTISTRGLWPLRRSSRRRPSRRGFGFAGRQGRQQPRPQAVGGQLGRHCHRHRRTHIPELHRSQRSELSQVERPSSHVDQTGRIGSDDPHGALRPSVHLDTRILHG